MVIKEFVFTILMLCNLSTVFSQTLKVTYGRIFNNNPVDMQNATVAFAEPNQCLITSESILAKKASYPIEETLYNVGSKTLQYISRLKDGRAIAASDSLTTKYELLPDTKKILDYTCKKARTIINSNTIEIWYAPELPYHFAPSNLGIDLGAVLETIRNGNTIIQAQKIEKNITMPSPLVAENLDLLSYRDLIWKSRFTTINILDHELINWNESTKAKEGVIRFANGTLLIKKVKFPKISHDQTVFVALKQRSNGDAYDRTGSVFVIPNGKEENFFKGLEKGINTLPILEGLEGQVYQGYTLTPNYLPNVELMRFFTAFGVSHFNYNKIKDKKWQEEDYFRQDITELQTVISDQELYVGTYIGNYDKGGHEVSLEITIHPGGSRYHNFNFALPIFNTINVMEMGGQNYATIFENEQGLEVQFDLKKPIKNALLRYITTGHGGWGGGDEFLPKANKIFLDDSQISSFIPWRQDCGSYRLFNPISGNFSSGLSSSDLSRSNWCPATVTNPNFIELGNLSAGQHTITVKIPQGPKEGSSFSFWNISGILLGNK